VTHIKQISKFPTRQMSAAHRLRIADLTASPPGKQTILSDSHLGATVHTSRSTN